jgi:hypothetical protein
MTAFVDSDWAQEPGWKSVYGCRFQFQGITVAWKSKRLKIVARSSMEAEHVAAGQAIREALHLQWLQGVLYGCSNTITKHSAVLA